jgi:uncharacterized protein (DUF2249 family)
MNSAPTADRTLDARDIDGPPFEPIMSALEALGPDERLLVINSFEPEPLYDILAERGFTYQTSQAGPEEWHVHVEAA